jgi:uncharacterized protein (TIGR04222 family)
MRVRRAAALLFATAVALLASIVAAGPAAAGFSERITNYRSEVTIERDGAIEVHETIAYDFGAVAHHGIYRDVPVRTDQSGKDGYDRVYPLDVVSVSASQGTPAQYTVEDEGDNQRIKIGDPDETITGEHVYDITYRVRGALNAFADHDELVWNAVGVDWSVPIERASAIVHAPAAIQRVGCATGYYGSTLGCTTEASAGTDAVFAASQLSPYQGMTFTVSLPKGAVVPSPKPILEERFNFASAFRVTPATGGIAGAMLAVLIGIVIFLVWKFGRDRRYAGSAVDAAYGKDGGPDVAAPLHEAETPVEFEPPEKLRPGELGTLIDFEAGPLDVTATIIDLAVRGYLRIEEVSKAGLLHGGDWRLVMIWPAPVEELHDYEMALLKAIFEDRQEVLLSELRQTFRADLQRVQGLLYDDVTRNGWFLGNPSSVRARWQIYGFLLTAAGAGLTFLLAQTLRSRFGLVGIAVVICGLLLLVLSPRMPARTPKGTALLAQAKGFRTYLETAEANQIKFEEGEDVFSKYLPFAIVFGVAERWAKIFADLAASGAAVAVPAWYVGYAGGSGFN